MYLVLSLVFLHCSFLCFFIVGDAPQYLASQCPQSMLGAGIPWEGNHPIGKDHSAQSERKFVPRSMIPFLDAAMQPISVAGCILGKVVGAI